MAAHNVLHNVYIKQPAISDWINLLRCGLRHSTLLILGPKPDIMDAYLIKKFKRCKNHPGPTITITLFITGGTPDSTSSQSSQECKRDYKSLRTQVTNGEIAGQKQQPDGESWRNTILLDDCTIRGFSSTPPPQERTSTNPMTYKAKNISQEVKEVIFKPLESSLQHVLQLKKLWKFCEVVSYSTQTSPSVLKHHLPPASKRPASSPAESEVDKKKKVEEPAETDTEIWEKEEPPNKSRRKRPDDLLIRPPESKSYADVLREIRQKAKPYERGVVIRGLRKTRAGDVLVKLREATGSKSGFNIDRQSTLGAKAIARVHEPMSPLQVRNLDKHTTKAVVENVKSVLGDAIEVNIFVKTNSRGQEMIILTLAARDAENFQPRAISRLRGTGVVYAKSSRHQVAAGRINKRSRSSSLQEEMMRGFQLNMQRRKTANDLLYRFASERGSYILLLSEQY
ncbi:hypothetical protein J6590_073981 [Homalodisca vitripennis]|nr:hypothetical protein J6590_073981 [Homalodisca vitripennis]